MENGKKMLNVLAMFLVLGLLAPVAAVATTGSVVMTETMNGESDAWADMNENDEATATALPGLALMSAQFKVRRRVAKLTVKGLREQAKNLGIAGRSTMTRAELEEAIAAELARDDTTPPPTGAGRLVRFDASDSINLPDQRAIELRGKVVKVEHPNSGGVTIEDEDGKKWTINYTNWTALAQVLERGLDGFYYEHWTPAGGKSADLATQNRLLEQANAIPMDERPTVRFVVITHNRSMESMATATLFSVVTDTYTTVASEDIYNELIEVLPPEDYQYELTGNDGIHAGSIRVTQRNSDQQGIFNWAVTIDCGKFNGMQSVKVTGGMRILFCTNQITIDVMRLARETGVQIDIGGQNSMRRRHAGDLTGIIDQIVQTAQAGAGADGMVSQAMIGDLSTEDLWDVMDYYQAKRGLSAKVVERVEELWTNETVVQIPETLYGLSMVLTYIGTHQAKTDEDKPDEYGFTGLSDGVLRSLRTIGGEILAIAPHWEQLFPAIQSGAAEYRETNHEKSKRTHPWGVVDSGISGSPRVEDNRGKDMVFKTDKQCFAYIDEHSSDENQLETVYWGVHDEEGNKIGETLAEPENNDEAETEVSADQS